MLPFLALAALAAPVSWRLDNGLTVLVEPTGAAPGRVALALVAAVGPDDGPVGATALALVAVGDVPTPPPRRREAPPPPTPREAHWAAAGLDAPAPHLARAGSGWTVDLPADQLGFALHTWAADLHAPTWREAERARAEAARLDPAAADALGGLAPAHLAAHLDAGWAPPRLTLAVVGDVDPAAVRALAEASLGRLTARAAPLPRAARAEPGVVTARHRGEDPPRAAIRAPAPPDPRVAATLARLLDARLAAALAPVATATAVSVDDGALVARIALAPGVDPERALAAWAAAVDARPEADELVAARAAAATLAHLRAARRVDRALDLARGAPSDGDAIAALPDPALAEALRALATGPWRADLTVPVRVDPEVDALAERLGPMVGELLRLRLDALAALDPDELPAWIDGIRAERALAPEALRPALDLLLERAGAAP